MIYGEKAIISFCFRRASSLAESKMPQETVSCKIAKILKKQTQKQGHMIGLCHYTQVKVDDGDRYYLRVKETDGSVTVMSGVFFGGVVEACCWLESLGMEKNMCGLNEKQLRRLCNFQRHGVDPSLYDSRMNALIQFFEALANVRDCQRVTTDATPADAVALNILSLPVQEQSAANRMARKKKSFGDVFQDQPPAPAKKKKEKEEKHQQEQKCEVTEKEPQPQLEAQPSSESTDHSMKTAERQEVMEQVSVVVLEANDVDGA